MENDTLSFFHLIASIISIVAMWKIYVKAGRKGWEAIIPIYNIYVLTKIIKKPGYWTLLMLIPFVGIIFGIWSLNLLSKSFGKGSTYTIGIILVPFIMLPLLAFGDAKYTGAKSEESEATEAEVIE